MPFGRRVRMVRGPARVRVRGRCSVLGADVSDSTVVVRTGKGLPFEPSWGSRLFVLLGRGGRSWWASPLDAGTHIWSRIPSAIFEGERVVVMVVGDTDAGKTTFCTYLANMAIGTGLTPCVIDGDIGQGDLAPPSAIGATVLTKPLTDLRDAHASLFEFVGNISPAGIERIVADRLGSICERSLNLGKVLIVNTDGYVDGPGASYKRMIAERIVPDVVVCLGRNKLLQRALASGRWKMIRARSSTQTQKSYAERRWRRNDQFLRFAGSGLIEKRLGDTKVLYLGRELGRLELEALFSQASLQDLFVALESQGRIGGFGIITGIDKDLIKIQTDLADFDSIHLSSIRLADGAAEQIIHQMPDQAHQET